MSPGKPTNVIIFCAFHPGMDHVRFLAQEPLSQTLIHVRGCKQRISYKLWCVCVCVCVPSIKHPWTARFQIHPRHAAAMRRSSLVFPRIANLLKWHPSSLCSLLLCSSHYNERARVSEKQFRCREHIANREKCQRSKHFTSGEGSSVSYVDEIWANFFLLHLSSIEIWFNLPSPKVFMDVPFSV